MKLLIVIVNWNGLDLLRACLRSIAEHRAGIFTGVCVVDNASTDGSVDMLYEEFPDVRVLVNENNEGFAKACNRGVRENPACEYVLFLNPDTVVNGRALRAMLAELEAYPWLGAVTCALLDQDGRFQAGQGHRFPGFWTTFNQYFFLNRLICDRLFPGVYWAGRPDSTREVQWISGAAMMVRRSAIRKPLFFNETYFMYGEDMEASKDLVKAGWELRFLPQVAMTHYMKCSIRKSSKKVFKTQITSQLLYLDRNTPAWKAPVLKLMMFLGCAVRWLACTAFCSLDPSYSEQSRLQAAHLGSFLGGREA